MSFLFKSEPIVPIERKVEMVDPAFSKVMLEEKNRTLEAIKVLPYLMQNVMSTGRSVGGKTALRKKGKKSKSKAAMSSNLLSGPAPDGQTWDMLGGGPYPNMKLKYNTQQNFRVEQDWINLSAITTSTSVGTAYSVYVSLNQFPNYADLASVFDQYRIERIQIWAVIKGATSADSEWISVVDYDDAASLASYAAALSYPTAVSTVSTFGHYRDIVPHVAVASYSGSFTSYANVVAPFIDSGSPAVQHYGVKFYLNPTASSRPLEIFVRATFNFRNVF